MRQLKILLFTSIVILTNALAIATPAPIGNIVYENAEDNNTDGWVIYDNNPAGAMISNEYDAVKDSRVIQLTGSSVDNGYRLGNNANSPGAWNNTQEKIIKWSMNYSENFYVYVVIMTTNGARIMEYTQADINVGLNHTNYITIGLGLAAINGTWQTFERDLETDLEKYEQGNKLLAVNGFFIRGSGMVDDVELVASTVYENAEDNNTDGWVIYDNNPAGAMISNEYDAVKGSRVIQLTGSSIANGYRLGNNTDLPGAWNNTQKKIIKWSMNYSENFHVFVAIITTNGERIMEYTQADVDLGLNYINYITIGLGSQAINGTWQTFERNLEADLHAYEPSNDLLAVNGFFIRGSGMVDDIKLLSNVGVNEVAPIITLNGDNLMFVIVDDTFVDPGAEAIDNLGDVVQVVESGNVDTSTSGSYIRTYTATDNNGNITTETRTVNVVSSITVYEDSQDENTDGWVIYDNNPAGAMISNEYDAVKDSRVIQLTGSSVDNGYRLGNNANSPGAWNNTQEKMIKWSMNYSENFYVYVVIMTTNGARLMEYTQADVDLGLNHKNYITIGLGSKAINGTWKTFARNLETDLHTYEPSNDLLAVNGFFIRGSGMVDDVELISNVPDPVQTFTNNTSYIIAGNIVNSEINTTNVTTSITKITATIDISGPFMGDLAISLQSPSGTTVALSTYLGGPDSDYNNTIFDDDAPTSIVSASAPFTGTFSPEGTLSDFNGEDANGIWTLIINDACCADGNTLNSWSITIN